MKEIVVGGYTREGNEQVHGYRYVRGAAQRAATMTAGQKNKSAGIGIGETLKPSPSHLTAETLAASVYQPDGGSLPSGYQLTESITDPKTGLAAHVYTSSNGKPVISFRGTEAAKGDLRDILTDVDPRGVGFGQFENNKQALANLAAKYPGATVTGHSLGGAIAQRYASNFGAGELITFNSPGIDSATANRAKAGKVTHYIAEGDPVSLGGEKFVDGTVKMVSYKSGKIPIVGNTLDKHMGTIQQGLIGNSDATVKTMSAAELSSPNFKYGGNRATGFTDRRAIENRRKLVGIVASPLSPIVGFAGQALGKFGIGVS